jgi:hypothetical protein
VQIAGRDGPENRQLALGILLAGQRSRGEAANPTSTRRIRRGTRSTCPTRPGHTAILQRHAAAAAGCRIRTAVENRSPCDRFSTYPSQAHRRPLVSPRASRREASTSRDGGIDVAP